MKTTIITDKDYQTELFQKLQERLVAFFKDKNFEIEAINVGRDDLAYCMGCFGCWVKKPGECVIDDLMTKINRDYMNSDIVIYLSPIIFGQFSANIKNAIDRSLPNTSLPFFITRPDGSTIHPPRYDKYPQPIIIGYGEQLDTEDRQLFIDITEKHRKNIPALIYQNDDQALIDALNTIALGKVGEHQ
ncbi:MAG TPA: flavodoxin family protein [Firmicutes bacterium]|jgi:multimeric flavodoxin WrbA|nr:flavodoxin family protein [Bacillota bacterium]